jgi:hypothetical protein
MTGYYIYASINDGKPSLQVVDADSQETCLDWAGHEASNSQNTPEISDQDLQELFRRLLLVTCRQKLKARVKQAQARGAQH